MHRRVLYSVPSQEYKYFLCQVQSNDHNYLTYVAIDRCRYDDEISDKEIISEWIKFISSKKEFELKIIGNIKKSKMDPGVNFDIIIDEKKNDFFFEKPIKDEDFYIKFKKENEKLFDPEPDFDEENDKIYEDDEMEYSLDDVSGIDYGGLDDEDENVIISKDGSKILPSKKFINCKKMDACNKIDYYNKVKVYDKVANHTLRLLKYNNFEKMPYNFIVTCSEEEDNSFNSSKYKFYDSMTKITIESQNHNGEYFLQKKGFSNDDYLLSHKMYITGIEDKTLVKNIFEDLTEIFGFTFEVPYYYFSQKYENYNEFVFFVWLLYG